MQAISGHELPELNVVWKRNVVVFGTSKGHWAEGPANADGSVPYTATAVGSITCEWEGGKREIDKGLPAGTVALYWPETGKVKIKEP